MTPFFSKSGKMEQLLFKTFLDLKWVLLVQMSREKVADAEKFLPDHKRIF